MEIGKVIRTYRKRKNMTQEDMASRLGVTAPAVNKWENGNSLPDIMLLAPIARLLEISLDTLLSFQEELTAEEIRSFIYEADSRLKNSAFEEVFQWVKKKLELYPRCEEQTLQAAQILESWLMRHDIPGSETYEEYINICYVRSLESRDENIRLRAADSLFFYYVRTEQYEKAQECLVYFSEQNPKKKHKQALLYERTGRRQEAYKAYEELLFSEYQNISLILYNICMLAMKEHDTKKANMLAEKQKLLARLFDMGEYYEVSWGLQLAVEEKDVEKSLQIMEQMWKNIEHMGSFEKSPLYEHMAFTGMSTEFIEEMKETLQKYFREDESCSFLRENPRWKRLAGEDGRRM